MRVVRLVLGLSLIALAPACGGSENTTPDAMPDPGNTGFIAPTASTKAYMQVNDVWTEVGPADWSCLGTGNTDQPLAANLTLMGQIRDFQTPTNGVPTATVKAFSAIDYMNPFATVTTDGQGNYTGLVVPSGTKRVGYVITATNYMPTFLLNQYYPPATTTGTQNISAISSGLATALPAFVGFERTVGTGVLAGAMRDCSEHEVANAIATVSSVSGMHTHLKGTIAGTTVTAQTYYFSAGSTDLPVNHKQRTSTNTDGLFAVFELPPLDGTAYIQVWGFKTDGDIAQGEAGLSLLAELPSPVLADTVITGSIEPKR